jgi:hypothetical protein
MEELFKQKNNIMKTLLFTVLTFSLFIQSNIAQTIYDCDKRIYCFKGASSNQFDDCDESPEISTFVLKNNEYFEHQTPTMTSTYTIYNFIEDKKSKIKIYTVISEAENSYSFVVNEKKKELTILTYREDMVKFRINKISKK